MFIKQTEHTHTLTCIKFQLIGLLSWWWGLRAADPLPPSRVGRFLRPEAHSAGYSAGVANKILTSMITSHYPRWQRITGYYLPHSSSTCNDASTWIRPWILLLPGEVNTARVACEQLQFHFSSLQERRQRDHMISAVCLSAVCRMTRHNLDQLPPSQGGLGLLQFWMLLVLYGAMYSSAYQFTLAKVCS